MCYLVSKKINLTNDEKKQFKEIQDELILKMPDLKDIIDNETGALNTNSIAWKNKFTNAKIESAKAQKEMSDQLIKLSENYSQTISLLRSLDLSEQPTYAYYLGLAYAETDDKVNAKIYLRQAIAGGLEVPQEVKDYINSN